MTDNDVQSGPSVLRNDPENFKEFNLRFHLRQLEFNTYVTKILMSKRNDMSTESHKDLDKVIESMDDMLNVSAQYIDFLYSDEADSDED